MSRKRFPASPAAAQARGRRARDPLPHLGGPQALVGGSCAFKGTLGKQLSVGRVMSAGNPEYSVMGVVGRGGLVQVPLPWRGGLGWERKLRVMLHAGVREQIQLSSHWARLG